MCMFDGADECYSVYNPGKATRAAKEHCCTECKRTIAKGETYYPSSGLYDGAWDTHHTCAHCYVACQWLVANCDGFLHHAVYEDISEHGHEYAREDLSTFAGWMLKKWKDGDALLPIPELPVPIKLGDARV